MECRRLVAPFEPEHRRSFGEAFQPPGTQIHESRGVLAAQFAHGSRDKDSVGLGFTA
jgi:hypothetical protein